MTKKPKLQPFALPKHDPFCWQGVNEIAILLVHGFPGTPAEVRLAASAFHTAGYTVQGLLLPGFGKALMSLGQQRSEDWVNAIVSAGKTLLQTHQHLVLVGNSMGAALSMQAAQALPLSGLILFAPFTGFTNKLLPALDIVLSPFIKSIAPFKRFPIDFADSDAREKIGQLFPLADLDDPDTQAELSALRIPTSIPHEIFRTARISRRAAKRLAVPTLVLQGAQDALVLPSRTRKLVARLAARTTYIELPDGHEMLSSGSPAHRQALAHCQTFISNVCAR